MEQRFTSKATSINKVRLPRVYSYSIPPGSVVVDYGCGRFVKHLKEAARSKGIVWYGYDPFNRTKRQNKPAIDILNSGSADYVICSNVLNVIDSDSVVDDVINTVVKSARTSAIFTIYEGNKSGIGKQTGKDQYQRNENRASYVERMRMLGYKPIHKSEYIIVVK